MPELLLQISDTSLFFYMLLLGWFIYRAIRSLIPEKEKPLSEEQLAAIQEELIHIEENRAEERECDTFDEYEFWEILNPLIERGNGNFFNMVSLLQDKLIRKDYAYLIKFDNTFLTIIKNHATELNQNIAMRLFPEDDWYFLTYMSFLMSFGEQRFNWLANYPIDLFKEGFLINASISISGVCGYAYFNHKRELIPLQKCIEFEEHLIWNDAIFKQKEPELFEFLTQVQSTY